jgi:hypothetical protein
VCFIGLHQNGKSDLLIEMDGVQSELSMMLARFACPQQSSSSRCSRIFNNTRSEWVKF